MSHGSYDRLLPALEAMAALLLRRNTRGCESTSCVPGNGPHVPAGPFAVSKKAKIATLLTALNLTRYSAFEGLNVSYSLPKKMPSGGLMLDSQV